MTVPDDTTNTTGQERARRRAEQGSVRLDVERAVLSGTLNNVSASGVMFTTDASLRVTIEVEVDGELVERTGRLSRVQRLNADQVAVAVEFDAE